MLHKVELNFVDEELYYYYCICIVINCICTVLQSLYCIQLPYSLNRVEWP